MTDETRAETLEERVVRLVAEHPLIVALHAEEAERLLNEADPTWRAPAPASPPPPSDTERLARLAREMEWQQAAAETGVLPGAVVDFVGRCRDGLASCASPDPTRQATAHEFAQRLRKDAPHLFKRGNGGAW